MRFGYDLREIVKSKQAKTSIPASFVTLLHHLIKNIEDIQSIVNKSDFNEYTHVFSPGVITESILKQKPLILKDSSNITTSILRKFNN